MIRKNRLQGNECLEWVSKPIAIVTGADTIKHTGIEQGINPIGVADRPSYLSPNITLQNSIVNVTDSGSGTTFRQNWHTNINRQIFTINPTGRICGLVLGENSDNSLKVAIMGNENISQNNKNMGWGGFKYRLVLPDQSFDLETKENSNFDSVLSVPVINGSVRNAYATLDLVHKSPSTVNEIEWSNFNPQINPKIDYNYNLNGLQATAKYKGEYLYNIDRVISNYDLSTDKDNTLIIGCNNKEIYGEYNNAIITNGFDYYMSDEWDIGDPRTMLSGDFLNFTFSYYSSMIYPQAKKSALPYLTFNTCVFVDEGGLYGTYEDCLYYRGKTHAFNTMCCNMVLTKNESEAIRYVTDGILPSDAFLYPLDLDNLPKIKPIDTDDGGGSDPDDTGGGGNDVDPDGGKNGDPTPPSVPDYTPQKLTKNHIYWLQAGEYESFINWYWNNAGDLVDTEDLWQTIQGFYNDLSQAIVGLRYMPVDVSYMGGASATDRIIVGMIAHNINCNHLDGQNPPIVNIGTVNVSELYKDIGRYLNYNPYADLSLYLPLYGFLDLDVSIFMNDTLNVKAMYDVISGTVQYMIYCGDFLINSVVAKVAVDLPITLTSKAQIDGAIMGNISSLTNSLINPIKATTGAIGLTMGMNGISNDMQGVPMSMRGSVAETGKFYMYEYCYITVKRPTFNAPSLYKNRVGLPSNSNYKLSSLTGYFEVYNPYIQFNGSQKNSDGGAVYPTTEEIEQIYSLLQGGVVK